MNVIGQYLNVMPSSVLSSQSRIENRKKNPGWIWMVNYCAELAWQKWKLLFIVVIFLKRMDVCILQPCHPFHSDDTYSLLLTFFFFLYRYNTDWLLLKNEKTVTNIQISRYKIQKRGRCALPFSIELLEDSFIENIYKDVGCSTFNQSTNWNFFFFFHFDYGALTRFKNLINNR